MRARTCVICGSSEDLTVEHVIPQALWRRFELNPNHNDLEWTRTTLCRPHNAATSALHNRPSMIEFIVTGAPVSRKNLTDCANWAVWVTMLLGLARGVGAWRTATAADHLRRRFAANQAGGLPRGVRVYAARIHRYDRRHATNTGPTYGVALREADRFIRDAHGKIIGYRASATVIGAADAICVGKVAVLVLGATHSSGPDHDARLDAVARARKLERIHPTTEAVPSLPPRVINVRAMNDLFTAELFRADDISLLPSDARAALALPPDHSQD